MFCMLTTTVHPQGLTQMKLGIVPRPRFKIAFVSFVLSSLCLVNWQSQFCNAIADPLPITATVDTVSRELTQIVEKQLESWNHGDIAEFMVPYWNDELQKPAKKHSREHRPIV